MNIRTALLVGASGLTGRYCLRFLLESDLYDKVTTLLRKPLPREHEKLQQHVIDFDKLEKYSHLITANDIFCCLGTTMSQAGSKDTFYRVDCTYPYEIAKLAAENGSERFLIVTAIGANSKSLFFYNRVKGDVENAISELPFKGIYIFRPSMLLGHREKFRRGEEIAMSLSKIVSTFLVGPLKRYRAIEAEVVAFSLVHIAREGSEGINIFESDHIQSIYYKNRK